MKTIPYRFRERKQFERMRETTAVVHRVTMRLYDVPIYYGEPDETIFDTNPVNREALGINLTRGEQKALKECEISEPDVGLMFILRSTRNPYQFAVGYQKYLKTHEIIDSYIEYSFENWVNNVTEHTDVYLDQLVGDESDWFDYFDPKGFEGWESHFFKALLWVQRMNADAFTDDSAMEETKKIMGFLAAVAEDERISKMMRTLAYAATSDQLYRLNYFIQYHLMDDDDDD